MKPFNFARILVLATFALGLPCTTASPVIGNLAYQGRLKIGGGTPDLSSRFDLRFHLYDASVGGSALDEAIVQGVMVDSNGVFSVLIDAHTPWSSSGMAHWVELDVRRSGDCFGGSRPIPNSTPVLPIPL